jgi:hypothetical protein
MAFAAVALLVLVIAISVWALLGKGQHAIDQLPGPTSIPLIGNMYAFIGPRDGNY